MTEGKGAVRKLKDKKCSGAQGVLKTFFKNASAMKLGQERDFFKITTTQHELSVNENKDDHCP